MKKQTERTIYLVAFIAGVLSLFLNYTLLPVLMGFLGLAYLALGWHLFNPGEGIKFIFPYFFIGFSFAVAFTGLIFDYYDWSAVKVFQYGAIGILVISIFMMTEIKSIKEKGINEMLIKTVLLLGLVFCSVVLE